MCAHQLQQQEHAAQAGVRPSQLQRNARSLGGAGVPMFGQKASLGMLLALAAAGAQALEDAILECMLVQGACQCSFNEDSAECLSELGLLLASRPKPPKAKDRSSAGKDREAPQGSTSPMAEEHKGAAADAGQQHEQQHQEEQGGEEEEGGMCAVTAHLKALYLRLDLFGQGHPVVWESLGHLASAVEAEGGRSIHTAMTLKAHLHHLHWVAGVQQGGQRMSRRMMERMSSQRGARFAGGGLGPSSAGPVLAGGAGPSSAPGGGMGAVNGGDAAPATSHGGASKPTIELLEDLFSFFSPQSANARPLPEFCFVRPRSIASEDGDGYEEGAHGLGGAGSAAGVSGVRARHLDGVLSADPAGSGEWAYSTRTSTSMAPVSGANSVASCATNGSAQGSNGPLKLKLPGHLMPQRKSSASMSFKLTLQGLVPLAEDTLEGTPSLQGKPESDNGHQRMSAEGTQKQQPAQEGQQQHHQQQQHEQQQGHWHPPQSQPLYERAAQPGSDQPMGHPTPKQRLAGAVSLPAEAFFPDSPTAQAAVAAHGRISSISSDCNVFPMHVEAHVNPSKPQASKLKAGRKG